MKTRHPRIRATTSSPISPPHSPTEDPAVIKLRLDKPLHWDWELTTSADALPVVQFLDKDGRLLVETTGRTAQRARGSFRDGLKVHEKFPDDQLLREKTAEPVSTSGNRNIDGFSSKYGSIEAGYRPRKSQSDASLASKEKRDKRIKKRHSSGIDKALKKLEEADSVEGERVVSPTQYSVGDFLRKQIVDDLRFPEAVGKKTADQIANERCEKVKAYLEARGEPREDSQGPAKPAPREARLKQLKEYLASKKKAEDPNRDSLARIKEYLQSKIKEKMEEDKSRPGTDVKVNEIRKRYSDHFQNDRNNYRTRKVRSEANIRFDPDVYEREKKRDHEETQRKSCRRSRSDAIVEMGKTPAEEVRKRNSLGGSDRRKVYRKTKSDILVNTNETSIDSDHKETEGSPRRIKSQDNLERSWREYKERKRIERLRKTSESLAPEAEEDDFMTKPRWKDLQHTLCRRRNCRVCENSVDEGESNVLEAIPSIADSAKVESTDIDGVSTDLQENYLLLDNKVIDRRRRVVSPNISKLMVNNVTACPSGSEKSGLSMSTSVNSPDYGYNSMQKNTFAEYKELCANSNVKKSDTFKVVDGSEIPDSSKNVTLTPQSNEDITRDYFKRVYSLLKQRQENARRLTNPGESTRIEDTSSSNFNEPAQRRRRRRRRKDVPLTTTGRELFFNSFEVRRILDFPNVHVGY